MHILYDENGNPIPHGSEGHSHEEHHDHEHGHDHAHHGEGHCGHCGHSDPSADGAEKLTAVLDYMLNHNEHHAAELDTLAKRLAESGKEAASEQIRKAVDEFQKGNLYLSLALSMLKEDSE